MRGPKLLQILLMLLIIFAPLKSAIAEERQSTDESASLTQEVTDSGDHQETDNNSENETNDTTATEKPNIIISEVQTSGEGSGTSGEEFIELYNHSDSVINIIDYSLHYVTSSGNKSLLFTFEEALMFLPDSFLIGKLQSSSEDYMIDIAADFLYEKGSTGLAATAGGLILEDPETRVIDEVYWTSSASADEPRILNLEGGKSAQRYYLDEEFVVNDESFVNEFIVEEPSPLEFLHKITPQEQIDDDEEVVVEQPQPKPIENPPIFLNELFIDPSSPQLDSKDEFVELFNPNNKKLDISGYVIEAGTSTKYSHAIPEGSFINPNGYYVVTSAQSTLTLTNSGGRVTLTDNRGDIISTVDYPDVEAGLSWSKSGSSWAWSTSVTPNSKNVINAPIPKSTKTSTSSSSKKTRSSSSSTKTNFTSAPPIKINEIFPDPSSPQKDSQDEFIELYNPHDFAINVADYTITSGSTKTYKHRIKPPANIPARGFYTVTSGDTSLTLTNSGGKVTLVNNFDKEIDSVDYPEAVPGSSWAFVDGKWQWTASPTKNAPNKLTGLIDGLANNKNDSENTQVAGAFVAGTDDTPLIEAPQPLPGWLLALLGVAAICYAAYEYRFEVRNYYYKHSRLRGSG